MKPPPQETSFSLRAGTDLIQTLLKSIPMGIALCDARGDRFIMVDKAFTEICGWPKGDIIKQQSFFVKIYSGDDYTPAMLSRMKTDIQNDDVKRMHWDNVPITTSAGLQKFIDIKSIPVPGQELMILAITDATAIAKPAAEARLIKASQDAIINTTRDYLWSVDNNLCLVTANNAYKEMVKGITGQIPQEGDSVLHPSFGEETNIKWNAFYTKALKGAKSTYKEEGYDEARQRKSYRQITLNPIFGENDEVFGVACYSKNITKETDDQLELEKAKDDLNKILEFSLDMICMVDAKGCFVEVSAASEKILGYKPQELIGKALIDYVHPDDKENTQQTANKVMEGHKVNTFENRYVRKDGSTVQIEWTAAWNAKNKMRCGVARDVTERKLVEIKLKEMNDSLQKQARDLALSNAELEQFAYVASHDLQEPLRMVAGFLTQLDRKYSDIIDEKGKTYIGFAVDGAKRMAQIIRDLLEFSKIGKTDVSIEDVDLNELMQEIEILFRKQIEDKSATIKVDRLPVITSYKVPLRQVFQNLLGNALKYSRPEVPVSIRISVKELDDRWEFCIADNGIGIDEKHYEKIFVIFQRLHNKDRYAGTGMGLSVTKKIIESMGGEIWVRPNEEGGTIFCFTIAKKIEL